MAVKDCCSYKGIFLWVALIGRFALVYMASIIDERTPNMKYTDTDYDVFTEAAQYVYKGESPYKRFTYRYTPFAAYICTLNVAVHHLAGKIVFCILDVLMGMFMWSLIESQNRNRKYTMLYVAFWIYNPVTVGMSTRGSNDNIIATLVFASLYFILKKQYVIGGLMYGFSVHFKIYPIIYCMPLYFFIDCDRKAILEGKKSFCSIIFTNFFTRNRIVFTLVSASFFIALTAGFYIKYEYEFLFEAYLYHFIRKDNRHNYSVYWYLIYQTFDMDSSKTMAILTFIP
jgi:GPI mannosyltransferase 1 subunit M